MQKLLIIKQPFWKHLSEVIKALILVDMVKGKVQAITSGRGSVYSANYKKYKVNDMNRFTTRTYGKGTKSKGLIKRIKKFIKTGSTFNIPPGTTLTAGTKLWAYRGQNIKSQSATPNMYLTGETIEGLEYEKSTPTSLTMSYKKKDEKKIINNELLGRSITTLNEANQEKVRKQIEDELVKNISDWYKDKIIITIGA